MWFLAMCCACALLSGCRGESADELFEKGEAATHRVKTYPQAEEYLGRFIEQHPDDPRADVALQALGRVLLTQERYDRAIARYQELARRFPESRYADQAHFMIGYIHDLNNRLEEARKAYQTVIDRYPQSDLVDDARLSIANLGKSPEAWLKGDTTDVDASGNE